MNALIEQARRRPRRTMIYVSGDIDRHLEKAVTLPTDAIIYDLHEPISARYKDRGREKVRQTLSNSVFRGQERVVRVNPLDSPWIDADLEMVSNTELDAVLFTGLASRQDVLRALQKLDAAGGTQIPIMVMIETPTAVLNAAEIAATSNRLVCLIASNANLSASMGLPPSPDRTGLFTPLSMIVLAARAYGLSVVDGAHLAITEPQSCEYACRQSRDFGFDGKAVIHPVQLAYTNDAFTPMPKDVEQKQQIVRLMEEAQAEGRSYAVMDGRLLQPSELEAAERCLGYHEAIQERTRAFEQE